MTPMTHMSHMSHMRKMSRLGLLSLVCVTAPSTAQARKGASKEDKQALTLQEAFDGAERALELGAVGDAVGIAAKLHHSHGLTKDEQRRLDLIDARCGLVQGAWATSEKILSKLHKASPEDARIAEWYARALDGAGKGDSALPLLSTLAAKDSLTDGDSYWALAQLERKNGQSSSALEHARLALKRPIVLQSDELDKEIHKFIEELSHK
jgi:hypothetical protein